MFGRGREKRSSRFLRSQSIRDGKFVGMMCDEDNEWNGTRTVSGRVRLEGFRATRKHLVHLARAAQIETHQKLKLYKEIDAWRRGRK